MNETRWSSLSSFCVEYPPDDKIGHFLAYVSLAPFIVIVSFVTLGINNREVPTLAFFAGQLMNETINVILKQIIRQPRPPSTHLFARSHSRYGMPSQHCQFMAFFTVYCCLYLYQKANHKREADRFLLMFFQIVTLLGVAISRVYLLYHTTIQCICGCTIGAILGKIWFHIVYKFIEPNTHLIRNHSLLKNLDLRPANTKESQD
ncbi:dolichyldiphosphatase 1-like [Brevipalpus obovatus]|uniref:dolichyldiphosphatase 1-like n=1 Tax=Brevipalpus obovatus TaxID=246614 RepID=UPI003D9DDEB2